MKVSTIDGYGGRFHFEPPVEVGERNADTLQTLATIAVVGYNATELVYDVAEQQVGMLLNMGASKPELVRIGLASLLDGKHNITLI